MLGSISQMKGTLPPVCLCWCVALVGSAILTQYKPEVKQELILHWTSVIRKHQYWRMLSTFLCFGGKFDMMSLIDLFFIAQSGARMEFGRTPRFLVAILACASSLLYIDFYRLAYAGRQPWLAHRLIMSLICLESWSHPWQLTTLPPLPLPPFPSIFLPPLLLAQNMMLFGTPWKLMIAPFAACVPALVVLFLLDSLFDSDWLRGARGPGKGKQQLNMMFGDGSQPIPTPGVEKNFVEEIQEDDDGMFAPAAGAGAGGGSASIGKDKNL
eukprot:CAMPEP_0180165206 /NCGR_PEP_ID=MMETSP0986-20121125/30838_1 /TAXON_ID=697907 /ORGANISM="non described non described, Strain CCMP2293" /LENGTH=268 /DNA_ID=CAMNT_0022116151 /DNA_START=155 /DNA_END=961 /DNA_ORIENTATION=+